MSRIANILQKILSRVEVCQDSGCWIWQGPNSGSGRGGGYGRVCIDGGTMAVHRVVYTIFHGPIPPKKHIDHLCRNRMCCNPDHLEMVTHRKNQKRRDSLITGLESPFSDRIKAIAGEPNDILKDLKFVYCRDDSIFSIQARELEEYE